MITGFSSQHDQCPFEVLPATEGRSDGDGRKHAAKINEYLNTRLGGLASGQHWRRCEVSADNGMGGDLWLYTLEHPYAEPARQQVREIVKNLIKPVSIECFWRSFSLSFGFLGAFS